MTAYMPAAPKATSPLDEPEQRAMDAINAAADEIYRLGLKANTTELIAAIHVLQGFVIQRMLARVWPEHFGHWFGDPR